MTIETTSYSADAAKAATVERDQSAVDRALLDLEKRQAELHHLIATLGTRLRPVTRDGDDRGVRAVPDSDPSCDSPVLRSLRAAVERTQTAALLVADITEGLDI